MSAFSGVFYPKSLLSGPSAGHAIAKGRSNAKGLFELHQLPSDNQIRNLLDPVDPIYLHPSTGIPLSNWNKLGCWRAIDRLPTSC